MLFIFTFIYDRFTCRIISLTATSISWYHNNVELRQSVKYMKRYIGDDYTFIINRVKVSDRGEFIIRAENHYGVTEEPVFLNVQPAPREIPRYEPEPLPVRKREPKTYKLYKEERNSAPMFTFHLRPRVVQEGQTCKLLACLTGQPHPTVRKTNNITNDNIFTMVFPTIIYLNNIKYSRSNGQRVVRILTLINIQSHIPMVS